MTRHLLFNLPILITCLLCLTTSSWGFSGPRSKPNSNRFYTTSSSSSVLRAKDSHYDGEDESIIIEAYRAKLLTFDDNYSSSSLADGMSAMDFVKDRADELASEAFGFVSEEEGFFSESCSGGDCDECVIPNEWKITDKDRFEVLEFLGIQRAEPLRKIGDWE